MQTNNHNATISVSQPTIIQVAKSNSNALLQNGQHLLIGKLEQTNTNNSVDNQSGNSSNNTMQAIYPLQYIETAVANANSNQSTGDGNNSNVYGSGGNKIFYQDGHTSSIYTSMSGQTTTIIPASSIQTRDLGSTVHIQGAPHAQIVHHGGNAYLVQSTGRLDDESPNLSHTTKASPVTVQWLCDNYETADGVSLPRSTLYNHYLQHCQHEKLEPMNQASFGKLIRSVFFGLRTRRLGTRGNSKYHYYGIRIKPNSLLNHYVEDQTFAMRQYPSFNRHSGVDAGGAGEFHWRSNNRMNYATGSSGGPVANSNSSINNNSNSNSILIMNNNNSNNNNSSGLGGAGGAGGESGGQGGAGSTNQHSNFLGESSSALPNLSEIIARAELDTLSEEDCASEGVSLDDVNVFCQMYLDHSDAVLSAVVYLNFKYIETLWHEFWRSPSGGSGGKAHAGGGGGGGSGGGSGGGQALEDKLSKATLQRLLKIGQLQQFLQLFDNMFYQSLVEVLIPNVLRPIPSALTQNIRHFAKSLEGWMASAIAGLSPEVVQIKMSCVCALAQTLRRHTSLNHLAQAARAVLKNTVQIGQMLTDLNRVDFTNVQEQASWVCGCDNKRVDSLQHEFKRILQQQASLEEWATWLDHVVTDVLEPYKGTPQYPNAAHQFILKWSFYSSMVIRDLTLRSAASFGSFHLIRLLYDEYIYYLVEQKVAEHLNLSPVAVTGEMGRQLMATDSANYGHMHLQVEMDESARAESVKQLKFKMEQGVKKESDSIVGSALKLSGDYGGLISYNAGGGTPSAARLASLTGSIDMDYHRISGTNSVAAGDSNQSGYNNSSGMTDDQVDESADDDEGLDEDFQPGEPITLSQLQADTKSLTAAQSVILAVSHKKSTTVEPSASSSTTTTTNSSNSMPVISNRQISSLSTPAATTTSTVRKTVNVTTFGEPVPSSTATTLTSSNSNDIPLLTPVVNKINLVSNNSVVLPPTAITITSTTTMRTSSPVTNKPTSDSPTILSSSISSSSTTTNISSSSSSVSGVSASKRIKLVNNNCSMASAASSTQSSANSVTGSSTM